ncbi:MAG: transcription factor S [Candidatus Odinarchaeum yellowstonii]|uniref:Transcription factor S n=1 Tax=Odinarchaeota yellowstonii (strain LCB_4) TaxID=1841599 RepID=A0AAF0IB67_ODILC|nr:MAG: transcription factor S [Candidatus Odinarchaeum yellowstonii]
MDFCDECGGLLYPTSDKELKCRRCGKTFIKNNEPNSTEEIAIKKTLVHGPKSKTYIVKEDVNTMPTVKAECPKCNNKLAYYWQVQTRAADEPSTSFFRCTVCGYTWREY